jgi:nucleotidyltransferase substrate binding protein (TIGR01987 family)
MADHWILDDYGSAVERLADALKRPATEDLIRAGCIQYFEFSFELAWKSIKALGEQTGLDAGGSPKACLKLAFAQRWIEDEPIWLEMLEARNRMAHTYDAADALRIYSRLSAFLPALTQLLASLRAS